MNAPAPGLGDVLRAVVPEPPPVPPARLVAGARRRVVRRRTTTRLASAFVVVAALAGGAAVLTRDRPDRLTPTAQPSGTYRDPMNAPVRPRAQVTAAPPPGRGVGGGLTARDWALTARSDDGRAFAVTVPVPSCTAFERVDVEERETYVLVTVVLREPGVTSACLGNVPPVDSVTYVVTLSAPLGDRALLHAAAARR